MSKDKAMTQTTKVAVRAFDTPHKIVTQEDKKNILPNIYKQGWKESNLHTILPLNEISSIEALALIVPTEEHNIVIVDFDIQEDFDTAMLLNNSLPEEEQCQFIVASSRKGGHFYYDNQGNLSTKNISPLHSTKGVKIDIQGIGHNVIAPTSFDPSKDIVKQGNALTAIPPLMLHYLNAMIVSQAEPNDKKIYLTSKDGYSDDNYQMVEDYIIGKVSHEIFCDYYNLPHTMEPGSSYPTLQKLAMRLLCDETIPHEVVLSSLNKYDPEHRQDHSALAPLDQNKYVENKQSYTLTLQHNSYHTNISIYYDRHTGDHIVQYSKEDGEPKVIALNNETKARSLVEKMVRVKRNRIPWHTVRDVDVVSTYTQPGGFDAETHTFNTSYINSYLTAFKGEQPQNYETPNNLLDMLKYMWGEEYDYLLSHTKWRYKTFEHSPVVHHLVGVEGSGKNISELILSKGFSEESQELDYQLFMDKHATHHILPNTVLGEVGDWNKIQQTEALSKIKTMSGCQGKATVRGMQQAPKVVPTINKIWVLGNSWMKLHNNPLTQRRVHAVYMPRPLTVDFGGPYNPNEIQHLLSPEVLVNFYYWLGNEYTSGITFTKAEYQSAFCRQKTLSYETYLEAVEGEGDRIIKLLAELNYESLLKALHIVEASLEDLTLKYSKSGLLVVSIHSLKTCFHRVNGSAEIFRALQDLNMQKEGGKLLKFDRSPEKYITIYDAPYGLTAPKEEELKAKE